LKKQFKSASNALRVATTRWLTDYEHRIISHGSSAVLFKFINNKLYSTKHLDCIIDSHSDLITDPLIIAESLNKYFASVYTHDDGILPAFTSATTSEINICLFSQAAVFNVLKHLKSSSSYGHDGIPNCLLKHMRVHLAWPLAMLFERSMSFNYVPNVWKVAKIVPILKKGNPLKVCNYRPISLTSTISKVMERIINDHITSHLSTHNLIGLHQFGFRKHCSTITQLIQCHSDWTSAINDGSSVDVIYLDYAKAFDSVVHSKLLLKLDSYGIRGSLLAWIRNFLSDRFHYVSVNHSISGTLPVLSGVPQGTVLGPTLFNIYVNDIPTVVTDGVKLMSFADDSKLYKVVSSILDCIRLQKVLNQVAFWSDIWQLKLNCSKSLVLHLGNANPCYVYTICNVPLSAPSSVCDLGVHISRNLFFHDHVKHIVANFRRKLFIVRKCFHYVDERSLKLLYLSYLRPTIEYGSALWAPHSKSEIDILQHLQEMAMALCRNNIVLESLEDRRICIDLSWYFSILHGFTILDAPSLFILNTRDNHRGHSLSLHVPPTKTSSFKFALPQRRITDWNALPNNLVSCNSVCLFKRLYRSLKDLNICSPT
jgi:hypothetical protein